MSAALRRTALVAVLWGALAACATHAPAPAPPAQLRVVQPDLSAAKIEPPGWQPVMDYAARVDVPGASALPPSHQLVSWSAARFTSQKEPTVGVMFRSTAPGSRTYVTALWSGVVEQQDWPAVRAVRSIEADLFRLLIRATITQELEKSGADRVTEVTVSQVGDARCGDYVAEGDKTRRSSAGSERRGVLLVKGKICFHPDGTRVIGVMAARWTPDGVAVPAIDVEVAPFLDSLQILPLGIGHLSPDRLRSPVARLDDFAARVTRVASSGTRGSRREASVRQSVVNSTSQHKAVKSIDRAS